MTTKARLPLVTPCSLVRLFALSRSLFLSPRSLSFRVLYAYVSASYCTLGSRATQRKSTEAEAASEAVREPSRMSPLLAAAAVVLSTDGAPPPCSRPSERTFATALDRTGPSGRLADARRRRR